MTASQASEADEWLLNHTVQALIPKRTVDLAVCYRLIFLHPSRTALQYSSCTNIPQHATLVICGCLCFLHLAGGWDPYPISLSLRMVI